MPPLSQYTCATCGKPAHVGPVGKIESTTVYKIHRDCEHEGHDLILRATGVRCPESMFPAAPAPAAPSP